LVELKIAYVHGVFKHHDWLR